MSRNPAPAPAAADTSDLALARSAATGHPEAVSQVDAIVVRAVAGLSRRGYAAAERDEIAQRLRVLLYGSGDEVAPRLLDYAGKGRLEAWIRVAALRQAQNLRRESWRELPLEREVAEAVACAGGTPEELHIAAESRQVFLAAFRAAFAALDARQRNLLRLHHAEAVDIQDLASAYGVHRVTASRWLAEARERLRSELEAALGARLATGASAVRSLLRVIRRSGELSVGRLLRTATGR